MIHFPSWHSPLTPPLPRNETLTSLWELNRVSTWLPGVQGALLTGHCLEGIALPVLNGWRKAKVWCSEGNPLPTPLHPAFFYSMIRPLMVLVLGSKISELPLSLEKFTNINRRYHGLCPTIKYFIAFESKHILSFFTSIPKHSLSFFLSFFFSPFIICVYRYHVRRNLSIHPCGKI